MKILTAWKNTNLQFSFDLHTFRYTVSENKLTLQCKDVTDYDDALRSARVMFDRGVILCYTEVHVLLCIALELMPDHHPVEILCTPI